MVSHAEDVTLQVNQQEGVVSECFTKKNDRMETE